MAEEDRRHRIAEWHEMAISTLDAVDAIHVVRDRLSGTLMPYRSSACVAIASLLEILSGIVLEIPNADAESVELGDEPRDSNEALAFLSTFLKQCREAMKDPLHVPCTEIHVRALTYSMLLIQEWTKGLSTFHDRTAPVKGFTKNRELNCKQSHQASTGKGPE